MENFFIWSVSYNESGPQLSFFVCPVHVQRINQGTREMIKEMLNDIGVSPISFNTWTVHHFLTDYLTDYPQRNDWEADCQDAWKIGVELRGPVEHEAEESDLVSTWAFDDSWEGEFMPYLLPSEFIIIADFYSMEAVFRTKKILDLAGNLTREPSIINDLCSAAPEVPQTFFNNLHKAFAKKRFPKMETLPSLSIRQRAGLTRQILISLGIYSKKNFHDGVKIAGLVSKLCHALGGTTTWREKISPDRLS